MGSFHFSVSSKFLNLKENQNDRGPKGRESNFVSFISKYFEVSQSITKYFEVFESITKYYEVFFFFFFWSNFYRSAF